MKLETIDPSKIRKNKFYKDPDFKIKAVFREDC